MWRRTFQLAVMLFFLSAFFQGCTEISAKSRFVDLGNGICQDTESGTMWQIGQSKILASKDEARQYAATQTLGGYKDWRLPTVDELYDLKHNYDLHQGGGCPIERKGNYWSEAKDGAGMAGAWEIGEQCDPERQYLCNRTGRVRLIRP